ncbi:MAG: hypothetical protein AAB669_04025 [Patescibacteria group bacterium]
MKIYIASSEKYLGKIQEDIYIRNAYRNAGLFSEIVTLKEIANISEPSDVVILRSIWGYHICYKEFIEEVSHLKKRRVKLVNDYNFIFWNIDKCKYLNEINHMNVVPTVSLQLKSVDTMAEISDVISETGRMLSTDMLVIKPCISASGYLTFKCDTSKNNETVIVALKNNKQLNFIAQPYRPAISEGEISVIMINGVSLYGVKRFPGILNDKLNPTYIKLADVPGAIRREIAALKNFFLKKFGAWPNICRVDFLKAETGYEILEVELIDPDLFFRFIPEQIKKKVVSTFCKSLTI